jgi:hypothetical protein
MRTAYAPPKFGRNMLSGIYGFQDQISELEACTCKGRNAVLYSTAPEALYLGVLGDVITPGQAARTGGCPNGCPGQGLGLVLGVLQL